MCRGNRGRASLLALASVIALTLLPLGISAANSVPATRPPGSTPGAFSQAATRVPGTLSTPASNTGSPRISSSGNGGGVQIFPYYFPYGQYYSGTQADVALPTGANQSPHWTAAPVGLQLTEDPAHPLVEDGPSNFAPTLSDGTAPSQGLRPYAAGIDTNGTYFTRVLTGLTLEDNYVYHYYVNLLSGTTWRMIFCDGVGCYVILDLDVGVTHMDAIEAGGEGSDSASHWGTISQLNHGYFLEGGANYLPWCYQGVVGRGTSNIPSSCYNAGDGWNDSWTVTY